VLLGLRLNKVALQAGQDRLGLCERQSHRRRRAAGRGAAAGMRLLGTNRAGHLHHDPPLHPASPISRDAAGSTPERKLTPPFGRSPATKVNISGILTSSGSTQHFVYPHAK
jgi:hypothetical protein